MKLRNLKLIAAPAAAMTLAKTVLPSGALMTVAPGVVLGDTIPKKRHHALRDAPHFSASAEH